MPIQPFFDIKINIEKKKLLCWFVANGEAITELRMVAFIKEMDEIVKSFYDEQVTNVHFIFNLEKITIPSNFTLLEEYAAMFRSHDVVLRNKLQFTIIQNKSNVFRIFFKMFKQYYNPVKPLYLCLNHEEVQCCLHDNSKRNNFPNIVSIIQESSNEDTST